MLLAIYPILFLFGHNVDEVGANHTVLPLLASAGASIALTLALTAVLGDVRRSALVVSCLLIIFFTHGHLFNVLAGTQLFGWSLPVHRLLFIVWFVLLLGVLSFAARPCRHLPQVTRVANAVAATLVLLALIPVVSRLDSVWVGRPHTTHENTTFSGRAEPQRDIYFLVFDRYGSNRAIHERFGFDNGEFTRWLIARGFNVAADSHANYPQTELSLAATLNLRYLDAVAERYGPAFTSTRPAVAMLQNHEVGRLLKTAGYRYIHIGSWWEPTKVNSLADLNPRFDTASEFFSRLEATTIVPAFRRALGTTEKPLDWDRRHYEVGRFQWQELDRIRLLPGPKFVFVHFLLPHDPYVFDERGRYVPPAQPRLTSERDLYVSQLQYTNRQIREFVSDAVAGPEAAWPIILLQADEGPHPAAYAENEMGFSWEAATHTELVQKFGILNASLLPGIRQPDISASITPVNTLRLLLQLYLGADLPLLPDRSFSFRTKRRPFDFFEVTDRLRDAAHRDGRVSADWQPSGVPPRSRVGVER